MPGSGDKPLTKEHVDTGYESATYSGCPSTSSMTTAWRLKSIGLGTGYPLS